MNTERIERIILRLKEKEDTHPNLSRLWLAYLDNKLASLDKLLNDCEVLLDTPMDDDPDIVSLTMAYMFVKLVTGNTT